MLGGIFNLLVDTGGGDAVVVVLRRNCKTGRSVESHTRQGAIAAKAMEGAAGSAVEGNKPGKLSGFDKRSLKQTARRRAEHRNLRIQNRPEARSDAHRRAAQSAK